jgi:hypothetical protein
MKKYKVNDEYNILAALPNSFQISSNLTSHRLVDYKDDPDATEPYPITVELESLNSNHILLYTPRKYMRIVWYDDPDEPNGQIDMGLRTPDTDLDFASWLTLTNSIPHEVITMAYLVITSPDSLKDYEVPLFIEPDNTNVNNYWNQREKEKRELYEEKMEEIRKKTATKTNNKVNNKANNTTKKKRKFKVRLSSTP